MIAGVIFDMDGLMIDTERLYLDLWCQLMRQRGLPERRDVVLHCIGLDHKKTVRYVAENLGEDFDYMGTLMEVGRMSDRYCTEAGVPVKPGLYELLDYLDEAGIPYAVATSTRQPSADSRLNGIHVRERLHALVTGDMVEKGKPEPDIFLKAAEALHLKPEECLVLEDSPHGILAAHRAGCSAVMIPDLKEPSEETDSMVRATLPDLTQVIDFIKSENT